MILKQLELKNFLSFKDIKFDFPQGLFLFDGYNYDDETANGAGKSAIFDSIPYILYGKTPRKCKLNDFVRWNNSVLFSKLTIENNDDIYSIIRTRNPDALELYINDVKYTQYIDVNELNDKIISLLGITYNSFVGSVYFAQNRPDNFLVSSDDSKKKILTEIVKILPFDIALLSIKSDLNRESNNFDVLINDEKMIKSLIDSINNDIKDYDRLSNSKKEDRENKEKYLKNKIKFLSDKIKNNLNDIEKHKKEKSKIEEYKDKLVKLEEKKEKLSDISNKTIELRSERKNIGNKIIEKYSELKKYEDFLRKKICFTCGQAIYEVDRMQKQADNISLEIKNFKEQEEKLLKEINDLTDIFNSYKPKVFSKYEEYYSLYNNSISSNDAINSLSLDNEMIVEDIERCGKDLDNFNNDDSDISFFRNKKESELKAKNDELLKIQDKILSKREEIKILNHLKDIFGKDGVRAIAFAQIIEELNNSIDSYVQKLFEQSISLRLELKTDIKENGIITDKIETKLIKDGREIDFYILSGGEQKRLVLAVDFALSEIVSRRNHNNFSFMILDEVFGGLDSAAKAKVMDFLELLKNGKKQVFCIDHMSEAKARFDNVIRVEKRNGISEIVYD